jgi:AcrR family transcriptional regulator
VVAPIRADAVPDRIIAAARAEFSRYGIAGARIDRIATAAKTSKERVYAYFSSKQALYRSVSARELAAVARVARMDAADLPGYAGRIHDYFTRHPERFRLMAWGQLEAAADQRGPGDPMLRSMESAVEQLRRAQEAGQLDRAWDPLDVIVLVNRIATSWAAEPDLAPTSRGERGIFMAARRAAVVAAVERLFPAAGRAPRTGAAG